MCLDSLCGERSETLQLARSIAAAFPPADITLVDAPREADIVLYVEGGYVGFANIPDLLGRMSTAPQARHLMFSESDWPYPILPGAFPSLARAARGADGWSYLIRLPLATRAPSRATTPARHLFSFLGRVSTHPVRSALLRLDAPDTPCLDLSEAPRRLPDFDFARSYIALIEDSDFVLCPRGFGASSIRIFEAMHLGRVPVIVGDAWREPPGAAWDRFSVRIAEDRIDTIPEILAALRPRAPEMGALAAETFRSLYAPDVFLDRLIAFLSETHGRRPTSIARLVVRAVAVAGWREFRTVAHRVFKARAEHRSR